MPLKANADLSGKRFGRLAVVGYYGSSGRGKHKWQCLCDCGATVNVLANNLVRGGSKSCGCARRETCKAVGDRVRTHGMSKTTIYAIWAGMVARCHRETAKDYPRYGGRGITVCERWRVFENFFADMGEKPPGMSLDRIDNSSGYSPENCRWASGRQQNINRSQTRMITIGGETKCLAEWAEQAGAVAENTFRRRLANGMEPGAALFTPPRKTGSKSERSHK